MEIPMHSTLDPKMNPFLVCLLASMAALSLAACDQGADDADEAKEETPAIPVEVALPERNDISAVYSGTAPVEAFADATVVAKVGGEIRQILVEEGDDVLSGQILARLDGDRLRLEMQQAQSNLQKLQRDFQRNLDLKDKSLISEGDFEKIRFEMDALQATYELTRLELGYTEIRAPIDGVVSERFVKLGNTIEANAAAFKVTSLEPLVSYLHVPEREYRRISRGQIATIHIDAMPGPGFEGVVARIGPVVDPLTGTFRITIEVSDPSRQLKPGMFGRVTIIHDMHTNAMQIPRSAVVDENGHSAVYTVKDGLAERRSVTTGFTEGGRVEILDGLQDTDQVVIVGQTSLKNGSRVSIINTPARSTQAADNDTAAN